MAMNEMKETETPEGYMQDQKGRLIPIATIKPIDIERDKLVREIVRDAKELSTDIVRFKTDKFGDIAAFIELSSEQYGVTLRGAVGKGNVTLFTFDGKYKVLRAISEHLMFDERLQAAKALIDECITAWSQGSRPEIQVLVNNAFQVDQQGKISTDRVLGLRRLDIQDERWQSAMSAISDAVQVVGSKSYIRVYERDDETGQYHPIPLNVASA